MKNQPDLFTTLRARQLEANLIFKPLFYRLQHAREKAEFNALLATPGLILADTISDQIRELIKYKNPGVKFSTNDLDLKTKQLLDGRSLEEFGLWVYYPWANRVVHTLDEEDFINIRTSRNQYKITREERDYLAQKKIGVIGLSVGQSVSVTLAMERLCGELRLADYDTLELNNLNRIRTGIHNLGLPKVFSVAREIAEIDPFLKVICYTDGLTEENMDAYFTEGGNLDLLIEESDGFDIKILSRYKARALKIPVLMEASDRCMVDVERFDLEPERSILHGIVDHLDVDTLKSLKTNEEKIPYMLDVLGIETSSVRLKASMVEMNHTINTWPQLASAVTMGGGITADVARRLLLNQYTESGRYHVDIEDIIGNKKDKHIPPANVSAVALSTHRMKELCKAYKPQDASEADADSLEKIAEAARLAPSYANLQPWKWASYNNGLFLFQHPEAGNNFIDPAEIGTFTSLGAALENAVLRAGELGFDATVSIFPVKNEKELVAAIHFKKAKQRAVPALAACIGLRHTNRRAGNGKAPGKAVLDELNAVMPGSGATLSFITDPEKIRRLAQAAGAAERIRLLHPQANPATFSKEIKWASGPLPVTEGVDIKTMELPVLAETAFHVVSDSRVAHLLHSWEKGTAFAKMAEHTIGSSSAIGLVSVPVGTAAAMIAAGRAVQKLWLTASKNKLAFHPICIPLYLLKHLDSGEKGTRFSTKFISELEYNKERVLQAFPELHSAQGVFLFRLSEADAPATRSLRKPLNELYFKL